MSDAHEHKLFGTAIPGVLHGVSGVPDYPVPTLCGGAVRMKNFIDKLYKDLREGGEGRWYILPEVLQTPQPPLYKFTIFRTLDLGDTLFTAECKVGYQEIPEGEKYRRLVRKILDASHPDNVHQGRWPLVSITMDAKAEWEQPPPSQGGVDVTPYAREEFLRCLHLQEEKGRVKYGTSLQTENGRDPLQDAKAEVVDLWQYLCQIELERKNQ